MSGVRSLSGVRSVPHAGCSRDNPHYPQNALHKPFTSAAGMVVITRPGPGRRNTYTANSQARLRHPTLAHVPLGRIITAVAPELVENAEGATREVIPAAD